MKGQLDLEGREHGAADELTDRQQAVYQLVCATDGGITADEAGALSHSMKEKRPHDRDDRCLYCGDDGRKILHALRSKGLVKGRRNPRGGMLYIPSSQGAAVRAAPEPDDIPF